MNFHAKNSLTVILIIALVVPLSLGLFIAPPANAQTTPREEADLEAHDEIEDIGIGEGVGAAAGSVIVCLGGGLLPGVGSVALSVIGLEVPVGDSINRSNTGANINKECVLDGLATVVREVLISSMTRSIVNWINNGFEGDPAFITDLEGFLLDVGDQVIGTFIEADGQLAFLCSPFQIDIRINLALDYYASSRDRVSCTLTGAIQNVQDAFGDFSSKNAWDSWFELSINPHNNAYGSFLGSRQAARRSVTNAQARQQEILDWGRGFQSYEVCDTNGAQDPSNSANISVGRFNCRIATPGAVINQQLNDVIGSGSRQLELADEINEIIGALLGQLANQVLGGSSGGLRGISKSRNGAPSYLNELVANSNVKAEDDFRDFGLSLVDESISIEQQFASTKKVSKERLNLSATLLTSLQQCYANKLLTTQSPTLTPDERVVVVERMNAATSTIASSITPLYNLVTSEIERAEDNLSVILIIRERLLEASSRASVERIITNEVDPLVKTKRVHTHSDFVIAQQQKEDIQDITEAMDATTKADLATCNEFPKRTTTQNQ